MSVPAARVRRTVRRLIATLVTRVVATALLVLAITLPTFAYWATRSPSAARRAAPVAEQIAVPRVPPSQIVRVEGHARRRRGIPVLTYHGIAEAGGRYTVHPRAFNEQIAALHAAGYRTITSRQFANYMAGRSVRLPRHPLLISFDDSAKSLWVYADLVLKRYGFRGVVFTITGRVSRNQPYYLTWEEIDRMHASGRWDFEAHTDDGHHRVAIDARGRTGAFLTHRRWLPGEDRLETLGEYRRRIEHDFASSKKRLEAHGLPVPRMFAFPFSTSAAPRNHPRIPRTVRRIAFRHFATVFGKHGEPTLNVPTEGQYLHRIDVLRWTQTRDLLRELDEARPPRTARRRSDGLTRRRNDVRSSTRDAHSSAYSTRISPGDIVRRAP